MQDKELIDQLDKIAYACEKSHPYVAIILFTTVACMKSGRIEQLGELVRQVAIIEKSRLNWIENWFKSKRN